jgi:hypothetical protein
MGIWIDGRKTRAVQADPFTRLPFTDPLPQIRVESYAGHKADDGNLYVLRHTDRGQEDVWTLESFRRADG